MGKSLSFVGSSWNFVSGCIKYVDTHHESFSSNFEKTSNKKVIAKKPLTNLYEMNSRRCQSGWFLHWWSMQKLYVFCRIQLKFHFWEHKKCWHISCKFQLEIRSIKKVISKKCLTNLYKIHSNSSVYPLACNLKIL